MTMKIRTSAKNIVWSGSFFLLFGCERANGHGSPPNANASITGGSALLPREETSEAIAKLLYDQNLISNPEVNRKMNEVVVRISRDGASQDSAMSTFHHWLDEWTATHPLQVEEARLAGGGYNAEAQRMNAAADSTCKSQTDSIRKLVQERLRRRVESARAGRKSNR